MYLQIDPNNGSPIYLQIIDQIKHAISIGIFKAGSPIPTIREIALELRVNPNTVAKAVRELEREGVLKTFVGKGSFVTEQSAEITQENKKEKAMKLIDKFIKDIIWLGLDKKQVFTYLEESWDKAAGEVTVNE